MAGLFADVAGDLKIAARRMRREPGVTITACLVLALGIGSSAAVCSVLYEAVLRPLPYPRAAQLFRIHNALPKSQVAMAGVSGFDYAQIGQRRDVFADAAIFYWNDLTLTGEGPARHVDVVNASASLFTTLGVAPLLGRTYTAEEDRAGAPRTAILSEALWRDTFGADPHITGRTIHLNGMPCTVTGVMPRGFAFPSRATQLWVPVAMRPGALTVEGGRTEKWLHMLVRLAPGVTVQRASAALEVIGNGLAASFPQLYPRKEGWHFTAKPLREENTESLRRWLYLAFGAVASVLLIACVNVSGLMLVRAGARSGETAVRIALGATQFRIARQILAETALLSAAGCGLGLLAAVWAVHLINRFGPLPAPVPVRSGTVLLGIALAMLSTMAAGLLPALLSARGAGRSSASRTVTGSGAWRGAVVAVQLALAFALIFTAAELSRSFLNMTRVPTGFDSANLWTGAIDLPARSYTEPQSWNARFFEPLLARLRTIPGVESAGACNYLPFSPSGVWTELLRLENQPAGVHAESQIGLVLPGYFETMRIPLLRGRTLTDRDRAGSPPAAVIDEELARRYFTGKDPIGRTVGSGGGERPARIVGIVGSVHNSDLGADRQPQVYYPALQERTESMYLVLRVKAGTDPSAQVRAAIAALNPGVALYDTGTMNARVASSLKLRRFIAFLLNGFAVAGLLLAGIGLHGSLAHLVQLRRREIGIRMALGARPGQVLQKMLASTAWITGGGIVCGAVGAGASARLIRSQLFGVGAADFLSWLIVTGAVVVTACLALCLPAKRAMSIDPADALREQ